MRRPDIRHPFIVQHNAYDERPRLGLEFVNNALHVAGVAGLGGAFGYVAYQNAPGRGNVGNFFNTIERPLRHSPARSEDSDHTDTDRTPERMGRHDEDEDMHIAANLSRNWNDEANKKAEHNPANQAISGGEQRVAATSSGGGPQKHGTKKHRLHGRCLRMVFQKRTRPCCR